MSWKGKLERFDMLIRLGLGMLGEGIRLPWRPPDMADPDKEAWSLNPAKGSEVGTSVSGSLMTLFDFLSQYLKMATPTALFGAHEHLSQSAAAAASLTICIHTKSLYRVFSETKFENFNLKIDNWIHWSFLDQQGKSQHTGEQETLHLSVIKCHVARQQRLLTMSHDIMIFITISTHVKADSHWGKDAVSTRLRHEVVSKFERYLVITESWPHEFKHGTQALKGSITHWRR